MAAKRSVLLVSLLVCGVSLPLVLAMDMTIDLRTGVNNVTGDGMTWFTDPYDPSPTSDGCEWQGVLKLNFRKSKAARAEIRMEFDNPRNFSFHIGDSRTNDGWGGDAGTQQRDAEVFAWNNDLLLYGSDKINTNASHGLLWRQPGFLPTSDSNSSVVVVGVANNQLDADRGDGRFLYYNSFKLFALMGQSDAEGTVDRNVFLGLNRVVSNLGRSPASGSGLCRVEIKWLPSVIPA